MAVKVVDTSALAAVLFSEPEAGVVAARLELANVCLVEARRYPARRAELTAAFRLRERLAIAEIVVDHQGVLELAAVSGLTSYDASYLWLTRHLGVEMATLDRRLTAWGHAERTAMPGSIHEPDASMSRKAFLAQTARRPSGWLKRTTALWSRRCRSGARANCRRVRCGMPALRRWWG
ncbi:MAG: type II toxin-antitoxin system VapC family toxin [Rhodopila sp.]